MRTVGARSRAGNATVVEARSASAVGSVSTGGVSAGGVVSTSGSGIVVSLILVGVQSLLDLVDETRHDCGVVGGWLM